MKNNNGQVLVVFILLLPLVLIFLTIIIDYGNLYLKTREIENNLKFVVKERFKYNDDVELILEDLLKKNIKNMKTYDIKIANEFVIITVFVEVKRIFPVIITGNQDIKMTYRGYKTNDQIKLEKE